MITQTKYVKGDVELGAVFGPLPVGADKKSRGNFGHAGRKGKRGGSSPKGTVNPEDFLWEPGEEIKDLTFEFGGDSEAKAKNRYGADYKQKIAALSGAQHSAKLEVFYSNSGPGFIVKATHNDYWSDRTLGVDKIVNNDLSVTSAHGKGLGTKILLQQVRAADSLGIRNIETFAARHGTTMNGYYTWPRLGYDAPVDTDNLLEETPEVLVDKFFPGPRVHLSKLMKTPEGREFWKKYGDAVDVTFNTSKTSVGRRVLEAYAAAKFSKPTKSFEQEPEVDEELLDQIWYNIGKDPHNIYDKVVGSLKSRGNFKHKGRKGKRGGSSSQTIPAGFQKIERRLDIDLPEEASLTNALRKAQLSSNSSVTGTFGKWKVEDLGQKEAGHGTGRRLLATRGGDWYLGSVYGSTRRGDLDVPSVVFTHKKVVSMKSLYSTILSTVKGHPHPHAGRPGHRGGSAPSNTAAHKLSMTVDQFRELSREDRAKLPQAEQDAFYELWRKGPEKTGNIPTNPRTNYLRAELGAERTAEMAALNKSDGRRDDGHGWRADRIEAALNAQKRKPDYAKEIYHGTSVEAANKILHGGMLSKIDTGENGQVSWASGSLEEALNYGKEVGGANHAVVIITDYRRSGFSKTRDGGEHAFVNVVDTPKQAIKEIRLFSPKGLVNTITNPFWGGHQTKSLYQYIKGAGKPHPHAGRPGKRGGSAPGSSKPAEKLSVTAIRDELLAHGTEGNIEYGLVTDGEGNVISRTKGEEEKVDLLAGIVEHKYKELITHHTHPFDSPPSVGDLATFGMKDNQKVMYAHSPIATYKVTKISDDLYFKSKDAYTDARQSLFESLPDGFQSLPPEKREPIRRKMYFDTATIALAQLVKDGVIKYEVIPYSTKSLHGELYQFIKGRAGAKHPHAGRPGHRGGSAKQEGVVPVKPVTKHPASLTRETVDPARLKALRIPPAWKEVEINPDVNARLQATGKDAKGRRQYIYSAEHSAAMSAEKFARQKEFHKALPKLRATIAKDLKDPKLSPKDKEAAAVLALIDKTGFRVGSDTDTGAEKQAYGASTLQAKHVKIDGDKISFDFVGKKGVTITKTLEDKDLAKLLKPRVARGGKLFDTSDSAVRDYLHARDGDFKVKDFRTHRAMYVTLRTMKGMPRPANKKEFDAARKHIATTVAADLGNTPAIALASYIDPSVWARMGNF